MIVEDPTLFVGACGILGRCGELIVVSEACALLFGEGRGESCVLEAVKGM